MAITIVNQTRGTVLCESADVASTPWTRLRGLIGCPGLRPGTGMFLKGDGSIHSAFMKFDFDAVFLDNDLRVVKLSERTPPWRARSAKAARNVLELAAGEISRLGVQVGDQLAVDVSVTVGHPKQTTAR